MPNAHTTAPNVEQLMIPLEFTSRPLIRPTARPDEFIVRIQPPVMVGPECTVRDAMARLGYSKRSVHRLISKGLIDARRPPGRRRYRVSRASLDQLASRRG